MKTKRQGFQGILDNIELIRKLTADKDSEALATLRSRGFFVPLTAGTHVKVEISDSIYPYVQGKVANRRYIGTNCMVDRTALLPGSDLPRPDPPVNVEEQQVVVDLWDQLLAYQGDGTKASRNFDEMIWLPFLQRHHLKKGWDQVRKGAKELGGGAEP
jgi:hypothetical protein